MGYKNECREEGQEIDFQLIRVCFSFKFEEQKHPGYEKGQDAAENVDDQVYQVITPCVEPVKMVIDGKREHGKNPGKADVSGGPLQELRKILQASNVGIIQYIWAVIEMERVVQRIQIKGDRKERKQKDCDVLKSHGFCHRVGFSG